MKKIYILLLVQLFFSGYLFAQYPKMDKLLYGVAYYDEYMPYERLDKDVQMMKDCGINVVRIAESTWSTVEPQDGVFDFSHIDRVLSAMHKGGISVIIGTPTYAVPTWMVKKHPEILAITPSGQNQYGMRQNMDITNTNYRFYANRVIRKMMEHVKDNPAVIGYQVDNETKSYGTSGPNVQALFVKYMQAKYKTLDNINKIFGLDYWSNRINNWNDFPSMNGTINASLASEFAKFQRQLVTDYLAWQVAIVREYKRPDQFITHNFDFEWRGYSFGIQPDVDHFAAAKALDIAGVDIYHPSQDKLTGAEISFGGDVTRSMKGNRNYLVMETEAQGFPQWTPYPGQLRLQAFSHLASGANMVEYWPWHSIHNSAETYWKGLLSHDFEPNPVYNEAKTIGKDFARLSPQLINLKKKSDVAILFSNEALSGFKAFGFGWGVRTGYNEVLRQFYDGLYHMNVNCDFVDPTSQNIENYKVLIVPLLYAAPDSLLQRLNRFVKNGGHIIYTLKSGFSDENVKVRTSHQPGIIDEACGIYYNQFTVPENVGLKGDDFNLKPEDKKINIWMELITPTTAKVLAYYDHPVWGKYAAITENSYGKGLATYIGCLPTSAVTDKILADAIKKAGLWGADQEIAFPVITKSGVNKSGKTVHYYFNYSGNETTISYPYANGKELLSGNSIAAKSSLQLAPWGMKIIEVN
ncbi:beta-galactosidase [Mucilaginibacter pocheonensis]|uniref:Beta-galactosidase n=1 Tax=Mucilaginibacter pocheonensis TaxID=398050 RepID=A0ABU1TIX0_9SPHI|nr:beta-galactosidase [Mucilaginibacter pocheonensis]MDR6945221.1 beta-galactosidase [Mucilaginibacter pocheonensis]